MAQSADTDFDFALRLYKELNGFASEAIDSNDNRMLARNRNHNISVVELSDDDETEAEIQARTHRSRSPIKKVESAVSFENQQAITVNFIFSLCEDHLKVSFLS